MQKPDLFIVTSAIGTKIGSIDTNSRFMQTLATVNSIKAKNPNSVVVVADASSVKINQIIKDELNEIAIFLDFSKDKYVLEIQDTANKYATKCANSFLIANKSEAESILNYEAGYIKNATEIVLILSVLEKINPEDFNRIFKISGRYVLSSKFNRELHIGKVTTFLTLKSNQPYRIVESDVLVNCILWSFDSEYAEEIKEKLKLIFNWLVDSYSKGIPGPDIEHGIAKFISDRNEISPIGILGFVNIPNEIPRLSRI
jgi:hypothetical protein